MLVKYKFMTDRSIKQVDLTLKTMLVKYKCEKTIIRLNNENSFKNNAC